MYTISNKEQEHSQEQSQNQTDVVRSTVSVVIPFHNAEQTILRVLNSLYEALAASPAVEAYEVIAVDDASTDSSRRLVCEQFPEVRMLTLESRGYYLKAADKGLFHARHEFVLMLTQGVFLPSNYFDSLMPMISGEGVYACGAKMKTGTTTVSRHLLPSITAGRAEYADSEDDESGATISLTRGNILLRRETALALGGYNTLFASHPSAEHDLILRGWSFGYKTLFCAETECQIVEPSASSQDWCEGQEDSEEEWNEMLMHLFYDHGWSLFKYRLRMAVFLSISLLFPISATRRTRQAYLRYLKNYGEVQNERTWRYGTMRHTLGEIARLHFK